MIDVPDSATMAAMSAAISSTGTARAETHELFSTDDIHEILQTAGRAREHFEPPGRG